MTPLDKEWKDGKPGGTPVDAASLTDLEARAQAEIDAKADTSAVATKALEAEEAAKAASIPLAQKGAASGVATLDGTGKLAAADVPLSVVSGSHNPLQVPGVTMVLSARDFGVVADNSTDDTAALQAAFDKAAEEVETADTAPGTGFACCVELPVGYTKVTGVKIASGVHLDGQGDKSMLVLTGHSNANLIQSKNWGTALGTDRGIKIGMGKGLRLIGNKANQDIAVVQSFVTADTALSTSSTTVPVLSTAGMPESGLSWLGETQVTYTGKTSESLTGVTIASGEATARKMSWVTPVNSQGHLVAIQGPNNHVRVYGENAAFDGIHFQGPDPIASGVYTPENFVHPGTRVKGCNGFGIVAGLNTPDGGVGDRVVSGPDNLMGALLVRSADWTFTNFHPIGYFGATINATPQAILVCASNFRGAGIYFDTFPGTTMVYDGAVNGWQNIIEGDVTALRYFQSSFGVGGGGHGVLFRGVNLHSTVNNHRFAGVNMSSPIGYGYVNGPFTRSVGAQNFKTPTGSKIQVENAMDFAPSSAVGGSLISGSDTLAYTGRQIHFTKLVKEAASGATEIEVGSTEGFDASGTLMLLAETGPRSYTIMQVTYTEKTATKFKGIPATGTGHIIVAVPAGSQRGAVSQHFLTGVSGGTTESKANASGISAESQQTTVIESMASDPTFRGFQLGRTHMKASDDLQIHGGVSGGKPMETSGSLSISAGTLTKSVAHNLVEAPTVKQVTPTADTQGKRWWVTVSSTEITVTLNGNAETSAITFDWKAWITP